MSSGLREEKTAQGASSQGGSSQQFEKHKPLTQPRVHRSTGKEGVQIQLVQRSEVTLWSLATMVFLADVSFQGSENIALSGKTHFRQG